MLFVLEASIVDPIIRGNPDACAGLENVLCTVYSGNHCVSMTPALGEQLLVGARLNDRAKAALREAANAYPQREATYRTLNTKVYLAGNTVRPVKLDGSIWRYPIQAFHYHVPSSAVLLAENALDATMYEHAAQHYAVAFRLTALAPQFQTRGGGGETIAEEFDRILRQGAKYCCACITDSDKDHPTAGSSPKTHACASYISVSDSIAVHVELQVREIENLLPKEVLEEALDRGMLTTLEEVFASLNIVADAWKYFDMKEGLRLSFFNAVSKASLRFAYWHEFLTRLSRMRPRAFRCSVEQPCDDSKGCGCEVVPGLGDRIIRQVNDWLGRQTHHKSLERFQGVYRAEWLALGRTLFEIGCATKRLRL